MEPGKKERVDKKIPRNARIHTQSQSQSQLSHTFKHNSPKTNQMNGVSDCRRGCRGGGWNLALEELDELVLGDDVNARVSLCHLHVAFCDVAVLDEVQLPVVELFADISHLEQRAQLILDEHLRAPSRLRELLQLAEDVGLRNTRDGGRYDAIVGKAAHRLVFQQLDGEVLRLCRHDVAVRESRDWRERLVNILVDAVDIQPLVRLTFHPRGALGAEEVHHVATFELPALHRLR
mmetsp:Transcript_8761/g.23571  ORF Transcript_8761/g.23571 Transcript_8761/m.23571 type:complete len:234 (-) Transcript_8761:815-1516(-)